MILKESNVTSQILDELTSFRSPHEDKVPHNVTEAIYKLYKELKANGTIINDLLHTAKPIIPNIFHFVRFVNISFNVISGLNQATEKNVSIWIVVNFSWRAGGILGLFCAICTEEAPVITDFGEEAPIYWQCTRGEPI